MAILDRESLEQSPLADLHAIASELSIDGYRRLRKPELITAILERQGGGDRDAGGEDEGEPERPSSRRRGRRRKPAAAKAPEQSPEEIEQEPELPPGDEKSGPEQDEIVEGVVELLPNGSGFVRVDPPGPSDPASFPSARFELESESDPTVQAIAAVTPIGRGSRVTVAGPAQSGKTELLRRLAAALGSREDLQVWVVLAGVRPEELPEWREGPVDLAAAVTLAASQDAQAQAVEGTVEQARRMAARGTHAVVLIDSVGGLPPQVIRKALAAARNLENGSLTVIATALDPLGGETTVIALDRALAREGTFPALDRGASWTMRADLLAG
jgi:transcription termination factor Rho